MAITSQPTRGAADLGAALTNTRAPVANEFSAVNLEKIKDRLIEVFGDVGLTDGTTAGSIWAAIKVAGLTLDAAGAEWVTSAPSNGAGAGRAMRIRAGASSTAAGGGLALIGGAASAGTGAGGDVTVTGGASVGGVGGNVSITAGAATAGANKGGAIAITGGAGTGNAGGGVTIDAGAGTSGGDVTLGGANAENVVLRSRGVTVAIVAAPTGINPRIGAADGNAGAPVYAFSAEPALGAYRAAAGSYGIAAGGALRFHVTSSIAEALVPVRLANGSAAAPSVTFTNSPTTGLFRAGADILGFATAGTQWWQLSASGSLLATVSGTTLGVSAANSHLIIRANTTTSTTPAVNVLNDDTFAGTGMQVHLRVSSSISSGTTAGHTILELKGFETTVTGSAGYYGIRYLAGASATAEMFAVLNNGTIRQGPAPAASIGTIGATTGHVERTAAAPLTTTDATVTTLLSATLTDARVYWVRVWVAGRKDATDHGVWARYAVAYREGGGATLEGAVVDHLTRETAGAAAWDVTIDTSGNDIRVRVTGAAATTIKWTGSIEWGVVA